MQRALVLCESDLIRAAHIVFESAAAEFAAPLPLSPAPRSPAPRQISPRSPHPWPTLPAPRPAPPAGRWRFAGAGERQIILRALRTHASRERAPSSSHQRAHVALQTGTLRAAGVDLADEIQMAGSAA